MTAADPQLQAQQDKIRIPIIGEDYYRNHGNTMDMAYFNCYPEIHKNPVTGESKAVLTKRPGTFRESTSNLQVNIWTPLGLDDSTMDCVAMISIQQLTAIFVSVWVNTATATAYVVRANTLAGNQALIGTIPKISALTAAQNSNDYFTINEVQIANAGTIYPGVTITRTSVDRSVSTSWWARSDGTTFTAASLTQIVAAAYPDQAGKVVTGKIIQLNGLYHVMTTDGIIYSSGGTAGTLNDPTLWNALTVIQTYQAADVGVGVERYKHHVVAFGNNSIEFFNDAGNTPPATPLERTEQAFVKFGCLLNPRCIYTIKDTLYWISAGTSNSTGVWKMDGYEPIKISTPEMDKRIAINRVGDYVSNINMFSLSIAGKIHLGINGVLTLMMPYTSTSGAKFGLSTDTCYSSEDIQTLSQVGRCGTIMYNQEDKVWWSWGHALGAKNGGTAVTGQYTGILPAPLVMGNTITSFTDVGNYYADVACFYLTRNDKSVAHVGNTTNDMFMINPRDTTYPSLSNGAYHDYMWGSTSAGEVGGRIPILAGIGFGTLSFGNLSRKRINRVELVFADVPQQSVTTWDSVFPSYDGSYSISLWYERLNNHNFNTMNYQKGNIERTMQYRGYGLTTNTNQRSLNEYGMPDRYYVNNLGMARYLNIFVMASNYDCFPLEAIEITLAQGTA